MRPLDVRRLGMVPYHEALALQRALVEERRAERISDTLLLLQHPAVITLGVRGDGGRSNILTGESGLAELGIDVAETGRGGDVTYHGPGQIVGYAILDLRPDRCDVHRYVRDIEEVMIRACAAYGVTAGRVEGLTGAWVGAAKIGAIGVRVSRWITSHGFAFNVDPNLDHFNLIVPCGISDKSVTSLRRVVGRELPLEDVEDVLARHFAAVFDHAVTHAAAAPV